MPSVKPQVGAADSVTIQVPRLAEITELYNTAVAGKDENLRLVAENAAFRLAAAEAAAAEAFTLVSFSRGLKR